MISGLSFIWETYYDNEHKPCRNIDQTCQVVPLNRSNYKCRLSYSIRCCCTDLERYEPIKLSYKNQEF